MSGASKPALWTVHTKKGRVIETPINPTLMRRLRFTPRFMTQLISLEKAGAAEATTINQLMNSLLAIRDNATRLGHIQLIEALTLPSGHEQTPSQYSAYDALILCYVARKSYPWTPSTIRELFLATSPTGRISYRKSQGNYQLTVIEHPPQTGGWTVATPLHALKQVLASRGLNPDNRQSIYSTIIASTRGEQEVDFGLLFTNIADLARLVPDQSPASFLITIKTKTISDAKLRTIYGLRAQAPPKPAGAEEGLSFEMNDGSDWPAEDAPPSQPKPTATRVAPPVVTIAARALPQGEHTSVKIETLHSLERLAISAEHYISLGTMIEEQAGARLSEVVEQLEALATILETTQFAEDRITLLESILRPIRGASLLERIRIITHVIQFELISLDNYYAILESIGPTGTLGLDELGSSAAAGETYPVFLSYRTAIETPPQKIKIGKLTIPERSERQGKIGTETLLRSALGQFDLIPTEIESLLATITEQCPGTERRDLAIKLLTSLALQLNLEPADEKHELLQALTTLNPASRLEDKIKIVLEAIKLKKVPRDKIMMILTRAGETHTVHYEEPANAAREPGRHFPVFLVLTKIAGGDPKKIPLGQKAPTK